MLAPWPLASLAPWPLASLAPSFIAGLLASYWIPATSGSLAHWLMAGSLSKAGSLAILFLAKINFLMHHQ